ncbi:MAG: hypothetical protein KGL02_14295 [Acidobacteriota bacterium]|nr:hypothetical protein [Acidobacteriota bacterium]MDE3171390.1 hypothetical protein [Acidobacteriota bacterium]
MPSKRNKRQVTSAPVLSDQLFRLFVELVHEAGVYTIDPIQRELSRAPLGWSGILVCR